MKKTRTLLIITLILCIITAGFTFLDLLCLHDIHKDYVSRSVLDYVKVDIEDQLPEWSHTSGEWSVVTIGYLVRVAFFIFAVAALAVAINRMKEK